MRQRDVDLNVCMLMGIMQRNFKTSHINFLHIGEVVDEMILAYGFIQSIIK